MIRIIRDALSLIIALAIVIAILYFTDLPAWINNRLAMRSSATQVVDSISEISQESGSCMAPWGTLLPNGSAVIAYRDISVSDISECKKEVRKCIDGNLVGDYQYRVCSDNKESVTTLTENDIESSTSENNSNSTISSVWTSCVAPWGRVVRHNDYLIAFKSSASQNGQCTSERRYCNNGTFWGSYQYSTCTIKSTSTTNWSNSNNNSQNNNFSCTTPRGTNLKNGSYVLAYKTANAFLPNKCEYEKRSCVNGYLAGKNYNQSCKQRNISYAEYQDSILNSNKKSCMTPRGSIVNHWVSVLAYKFPSLTCSQISQGIENNPSQYRTCNNGILNGSYSYAYAGSTPSCQFTCTTPRGSIINHWDTIVAFAQSSVPYGQSCQSQVRTCSFGQLLGNYQNKSCSVSNLPNQSCNNTARGNLSNGQSVTAYSVSSVPSGQSCENYKEIRTCFNGYLNGSNPYASCSTQNNPNPTPTPDTGSCKLPSDGVVVPNYSNLPAYRDPNNCSDSAKRYCYHGYLDWDSSYSYGSCR